MQHVYPNFLFVRVAKTLPSFFLNCSKTALYDFQYSNFINNPSFNLDTRKYTSNEILHGHNFNTVGKCIGKCKYKFRIYWKIFQKKNFITFQRQTSKKKNNFILLEYFEILFYDKLHHVIGSKL